MDARNLRDAIEWLSGLHESHACAKLLGHRISGTSHVTHTWSNVCSSLQDVLKLDTAPPTLLAHAGSGFGCSAATQAAAALAAVQPDRATLRDPGAQEQFRHSRHSDVLTLQPRNVYRGMSL